MEESEKNNYIEIDVKNINWNMMTYEEFNQLEITYQKQQKNLKKSKKNVKDVVVLLKNKMYLIKFSVYTRLKNLTSEKSKEKLIEQIIMTHNPIQEY